jgi:hypothetical protein
VPRKNSQIDIPELNFDPAKDRVEIIKTQHAGDLKAIKEFYEEKSEPDACFRLMQDIIVVVTSEGFNLPTSSATKKECVEMFMEITSKGKVGATTTFDKAMRASQGINIAAITNHAAAVAQDIVGRIYKDLNHIDTYIDAIEFKINNAEDLEIPRTEVDKLEKQRINLILRKDKMYKQLGDYSKDYGVDLGVKVARNEIEKDKVRVLENKAQADSNWQSADIALRTEGKTYEEKIAMLANALGQDREFNNLIETKMDEEGFVADVEEEEVEDA